MQGFENKLGETRALRNHGEAFGKVELDTGISQMGNREGDFVRLGDLVFKGFDGGVP